MLDVHNNSAPSNIMKLFVRTSNNYTYIPLAQQHRNLLGLSTPGVKIQNEMPNEQKNLSKKSSKKETKALLNILEAEDSYIKPNEIMVINLNMAKLKQIELAVVQYLWCTQILRIFFLLQ